MKKKLFFLFSLLMVGLSLYAMSSRDKIAKMKQASKAVRATQTATSPAELDRLQKEAQSIVDELNLKATQKELTANTQTRNVQLALPKIQRATQQLNAIAASPQFAVGGATRAFADLMANDILIDDAANTARLEQIGNEIRLLTDDIADLIAKIDREFIQQQMNAIRLLRQLQAQKAVATQKAEKDRLEQQIIPLVAQTKQYAQLSAALDQLFAAVPAFNAAFAQFLPIRNFIGTRAGAQVLAGLIIQPYTDLLRYLRPLKTINDNKP